MALVKEETTEEMITVQRDNVILDVPKAQKEYYKNLGYNVIDEKTGKVIEETVPTDLAALQRFYKDANAKIVELEKQIKELNKELKEASKKPAKVKEVIVASPEPVEPVKEVKETTSSSRKRRSK